MRNQSDKLLLNGLLDSLTFNNVAENFPHVLDFPETLNE
jgi:hypothetical protein